MVLDEIRNEPWQHPYLDKSAGDQHLQSFNLSSPGHYGEFGTDDVTY